MKISIITTTFNCVETVRDCLCSVACQSYSALEHIVIDGASSDGTLALLESRNEQLSVLLSEADDGLYYGLNKGISYATGDVVGILHADDLFADSEVLCNVAAAFERSDVLAVYGDLNYVRRNSTARVVRHWKAGAFKKNKLKRGWMPPHPTLYLRRSVYEKFGCFNTGYSIAADYDFMLRVLSQLEGHVVYLPHVLVKMRVGGLSNRAWRNVLRKSVEDYRVLREHDIGGLGALAWKNLSKLSQFVRRTDSGSRNTKPHC